MGLKPRKITLTGPQQIALNMMAQAHRDGVPVHSGWAATVRTPWSLLVNSATMEALFDRALAIRHFPISTPSSDEISFTLTERGWELAR